MAYSVKAVRTVTHGIRVWRATTVAPDTPKRTSGLLKGVQGISYYCARNSKHKGFRVNGIKVK